MKQAKVSAYKPVSRAYLKWKFLRGSIIVIEGGIANGKTTLMDNMERYLTSIGLDVQVYPEPIMDEFLKLFLSDQKRYAFAFQMAMMMKRREIYADAAKKCSEGKICIIDRSMHGDMCFATMHRENGNITTDEWNAYTKEFLEGHLPHPDYVIYLDVDPEVAIERCMIRNRPGEKTSYTVKYFQDLKRVYESIIPTTFNALRLDWNEDRSKENPEVGVNIILSKLKEMFCST